MIPGPLADAPDTIVLRKPEAAAEPGPASDEPFISGDVAVLWLRRKHQDAAIIIVSATCGACTGIRKKIADLQAAGSLAGASVGLLPATEWAKVKHHFGNFNVEGVPTTLKVGDGKIKAAKVGNMPHEDLRQFVHSH